MKMIKSFMSSDLGSLDKQINEFLNSPEINSVISIQYTSVGRCISISSPSYGKEHGTLYFTAHVYYIKSNIEESVK